MFKNKKIALLPIAAMISVLLVAAITLLPYIFGDAGRDAFRDDEPSGNGAQQLELTPAPPLVVLVSPTPVLPETPTPTPTPEPTPEPTPMPPATDLTDALSVTLSSGQSESVLLDRDYTTKRAFGAGTSIFIEAPEEMHSLYVIWDLPPGEWSIVGDSSNSSQICGENDFIHELVPLSSPSRELTVRLPTDGATLCDVYAFSEGYLPDWVQVWLLPHEKADMLVVPVHADDEHLYFGGTLPYYAGELGYKVQVAYMTNHWNEPPRPHELLNGLWTVGVTNYPVIGHFRDLYSSSLADARSQFGWDNVVSFHVELLRRFKPLVVVGHDLNGEYGHGAHMISAHALVAAVEAAADDSLYLESFERYGTWDTPKLYLHLYRENTIIMNWDIPLERFGGATAFEMAEAGYACHISQHRWSFAVRQSGTYDCRKFGLARSLVGLDIVGADMFENIGDVGVP